MRVLYEKQVQEGNKKPTTKTVPTSLKASMDDKRLQVLIAAGWTLVVSINEITEGHAADCINQGYN